MLQGSVASPGGFVAKRTEKTGIVRSRLGIGRGTRRSAPSKESLRTPPQTVTASRRSARAAVSLPKSGDTTTPATKINLTHSGITSTTCSTDKHCRKQGPGQRRSRKSVQSAPVNGVFFRVKTPPSTSFIELKDVSRKSKPDCDISQLRSSAWGSDQFCTSGRYGGKPDISDYTGNSVFTDGFSGDDWKTSFKLRSKDSNILTARSGDTLKSSQLTTDILWNRVLAAFCETEKQKQEWYNQKLADWTQKKNKEEQIKRSLEKKAMEDKVKEKQSKKELEERIFKEWLQKKDKELKQRRSEKSESKTLRQQEESEKKTRQKSNFNEWVKKKDDEFKAKRERESRWWDKDDDATIEEIRKHMMSKAFTEKLIERRNKEIVAEMRARELRRQQVERLRQEYEERRRRIAERPWAVWNENKGHFAKITPVTPYFRVGEGCHRTLLPVKLDHK